MSIGEIAMLVNDNFDKPLNQQIRDMQFWGSYLFTSTGTFTPDKKGYYKIIVVGSGGTSSSYSTTYSKTVRGGSGGVAISTLLLEKSAYSIEINDDESTFSYSSETVLRAGAGTDADASDKTNGVGGYASGGDFNYPGNDGTTVSVSSCTKGMDVGVIIPSLMQSVINRGMASSSDVIILTAESGDGILGYGGGSGRDYDEDQLQAHGKGGCVLIIPLELTE